MFIERFQRFGQRLYQSGDRFLPFTKIASRFREDFFESFPGEGQKSFIAVFEGRAGQRLESVF